MSYTPLYPHGEGIKGYKSFLSIVVRVPSRFMRKIVCRLRLNEVSRQ